MKFNYTLAITAVSGLLIGVALTNLWSTKSGESSSNHSQAQNATEDSAKVLYWVAPMDPDYRRDKPGKSPMGMDLIPVYESVVGDSGPGTVYISPDVVNNLGVRTAQVQQQSLNAVITTVGYVQYDQDRLLHIHPRVEGWVEKLFVKAAGDPVQKGAPLYELYSPQLVNAQEELQLALNRNNERLVDAAKNRLKALQLSDEFIAQALRDQQVRQTVTFYAPQTGVVDNLNIREGFYVMPGTTLMSIAAMDEVWVEAEIFERQASLVKVGLPVSMYLDYLPGEKWHGKVDYVYPTLDPKTRTARVRLRFDNSLKKLKPNMFAQVEIHSQGAEEEIVIPSEAVIRTGNQDRVVLALGEGRFKSVSVTLGRVVGTLTEVKNGIKVGDRVVTSAQFLLDSESSKNSDFRRINHDLEKPASVWVSAEILTLDADQNRVTATHDAIPEWQWPIMTMDFAVADSVDIKQLTPGTRRHIQIAEYQNDRYQITAIHSAETESVKAPQTATVTGVVQAIDAKNRKVTVHREAIPKWNRAAASVVFDVAKTVDLAHFQLNQAIKFTFEIVSGQFVIVAVEKSPQATTESEMSEAPRPGVKDHAHPEPQSSSSGE